MLFAMVHEFGFTGNLIQIFVLPLQAVIQRSSPEDACQDVLPADRDFPALQNSSFKWFALVDRAFGYCDMQTKASHSLHSETNRLSSSRTCTYRVLAHPPRSSK